MQPRNSLPPIWSRPARPAMFAGARRSPQADEFAFLGGEEFGGGIGEGLATRTRGAGVRAENEPERPPPRKASARGRLQETEDPFAVCEARSRIVSFRK